MKEQKKVVNKDYFQDMSQNISIKPLKKETLKL